MKKFLAIKGSEILTGIVLLVSILVMGGWLFQFKAVLSIIPNSATMKFNTALLFFLSGLCVVLLGKNQSFFKALNLVFAGIILLISLLTFSEYFNVLDKNIDNMFVTDNYSSINHGRMSMATAFCFALFSIGLWGSFSDKQMIRSLFPISFLAIVVIAFISAITYILLIPSENKSPFFQTMAIHTAFLFLILTYLTLKKGPDSEITRLLWGKSPGSKMMRRLLPFILILSLALGFLLLLAINRKLVATDFGVLLFTISFILLSVIYISIIAQKLNIAEIKKLELEQSLLAKNKELLQYKYGLDQIAITAITDKNGVIEEVNDHFCEVSKYSREELIGKTHAIINSGFHSREFFKAMWQTIKSGEIWVGEIKNKTKTGSYYWVDTAIIPLKDEKEEIQQFIAIRQDITERKKAEEMLSSQYVKRLEQKNSELEQFAFIASHDLQEPLLTITNFSQLLQKKNNQHLDELTQKSLLYIHKASSRMSTLIRGLMEYSRIGSGMEIKTVDCNSILSEIRDELSTQISYTKARIKANELPQLMGQYDALKQLFLHLITNALKFRNPDLPPQIELSTRQNQDFWEFQIRDNGIGISEKHLNRIFLIYQQLNTRKQFAGEGIGVGLAYCKKIVELHGGKIWAESHTGKGSTFYFTISKELAMQELE
ncbi:sensor histidine kinase [Flexithrix dorotheae]|uniref:sensor histidine kinase n=1 Tax=Flexithrix dorotheae TaxID=70993 RepID=UPI0003680DC5|nr:ATP-binding protein [Flexithrix dorotheae]